MAASSDGAPVRVSAISIFYNAEAYLREAIDSVLAQEFSDWELLLVDDGSGDASGAIAKDYAERDLERIRYLQHPAGANRGMSASRNLGLTNARGEFVAFIDADDRWRPNKLREQIELLDQMPEVDAVCGAVNYWASHEGGQDRIVPTARLRDRPIPAPEAIWKLYPLGRATAPSMSDLLFRRSSLAAIGGFEEAFAGAYEDQAMLAKFYLQSSIYVSGAVWSDYRLHADSCMSQVKRNGSYHQARRSFLTWFERYLTGSRNRDDERIQRALTRALLRNRRSSETRRVGEAARAALTGTYVGSMVRSGKAALRRLRPLLTAGPAILMYHRIADESFDPWQLAVSPANFADQLEWIARHRTPLPLAEFAELSRRGRLPRNAIALTFDDGYACNADLGIPLLAKFGIPATIFLPVELIERGREFWWDELERIVLRHTGRALTVNGSEIEVGEIAPDDRQWPPGERPRTARQIAYHQLWSLLYEMTPADLEAAMQQLRDQARLAEAPRQSHRPLTREQIGQIRSDLVQFGSHGLTHPSLPRLGSAEKAREIRDSVDRCAQLTGVQPRSFAYPYGDFDPESEQLAEQAGFSCACKADGWFVTKNSSRFALPRIFVGNWDSSRLARQLGRP
jgi:peptidoglycan/xylan/chitin deacetylase (PgdA/CDA1 family)/glycosyltransferase involved in cell wall biosynthesis